MRNDWGRSWLAKEQFLDLLLSQQDLMEDHLKPYQEFIEKEKGEPYKNVALVYSIINFTVLSQIENDIFDPIIVKYEDLVLNPKNALKKLILGLNLENVCNVEKLSMLRKDSDTTQKNRKSYEKNERLTSWKNELTPEQIEQISRIVTQFEYIPDIVL